MNQIINQLIKIKQITVLRLWLRHLLFAANSIGNFYIKPVSVSVGCYHLHPAVWFYSFLITRV